jgi:hypothetical protein
MSQGRACSQPRAHKAAWRVLVRNAHHSVFAGGRRTPSAYSAVYCGWCGAVWRTKAGYVAELADSSWYAYLSSIEKRG